MSKKEKSHTSDDAELEKPHDPAKPLTEPEIHAMLRGLFGLPEDSPDDSSGIQTETNSQALDQIEEEQIEEEPPETKLEEYQKRFEEIQALLAKGEIEQVINNRLVEDLFEEISQTYDKIFTEKTSFENALNNILKKTPSNNHIPNQIFILKVKIAYLRLQLKNWEENPSRTPITANKKPEVKTGPLLSKSRIKSWTKHTPTQHKKEILNDDFSTMEITLGNGTKMIFVVPKKHEKTISQDLLELIEIMEMTIQDDLRKNGVKTIDRDRNIAIIFIKGINQYYVIPHIIAIDGSNLENLDLTNYKTIEFLDDYIHERVHSFTCRIMRNGIPFLTEAPDVSAEIAEGFAVYESKRILDILDIPNPDKTHLTRTATDFLKKELKKGKPLLQALESAIKDRIDEDEKEIYGPKINGPDQFVSRSHAYEHGYAFVEAFIRHLGFTKFFELYENSSDKNTLDPIGDWRKFMSKLKIGKDKQDEVLEDTARVMLCERRTWDAMREYIVQNAIFDNKEEEVTDFMEMQKLSILLRTTSQDPKDFEQRYKETIDYFKRVKLAVKNPERVDKILEILTRKYEKGFI